MELLAVAILKMLSVGHSLRESLLRWLVYLVSHYSETLSMRERCVIRKSEIFFFNTERKVGSNKNYPQMPSYLIVMQ